MVQGVSEGPSLREGQVVDGRYQLFRRLGAGGMGEVWIATHVATSRRVALKVILPQRLARDAATLLARFQREAQALGRIESPHVTQVLDAGSDSATKSAFLVMELLQGEDVEKLMGRLGPLPPQLTVRVAWQSLLGLSAAHQAGIVHRDIKPANLFLSRRATGEHEVKLLDFGIVKMNEEQAGGDAANVKALTATGTAFGSVPYMSPEQLTNSKQVDARADLWSLGVSLYEALSGRSAFVDAPDLGAVVMRILTGAPAPLAQVAPWVPPGLVAVVERAMRRDPNERFASAQEMIDAIRPLVNGAATITDDLVAPIPGLRGAGVAAPPGAVAGVPPGAVAAPQPAVAASQPAVGASQPAVAASQPVGSISAVPFAPTVATPTPSAVVGRTEIAAGPFDPRVGAQASLPTNIAASATTSGGTRTIALVLGAVIVAAVAVIVTLLATRDGAGSGSAVTALPTTITKTITIAESPATTTTSSAEVTPAVTRSSTTATSATSTSAPKPTGKGGTTKPSTTITPTKPTSDAFGSGNK